MNEIQNSNDLENYTKDEMSIKQSTYRLNNLSNTNNLDLYLKPIQSFGMENEPIDNNVQFIDDKTIVYISGNNIAKLNLLDKAQNTNYLIRSNYSYKITCLSIGQNKDNKKFIVLGEINLEQNLSQISIIDILSGNQTTLKNEEIYLDNKIHKCLMMGSTNYLLALTKNLSNNVNKDTYKNITKLSLWKYTQNAFISEVKIEETIYNYTYNPYNNLEIIICGLGYLRLWNIFINDGKLKEHPEKFLNSKIENEYSFIKVEFFTFNSDIAHRSFMFIAATLENKFLIIKGFSIISEIDVNVDIYNTVNMNLNISSTKKDEDNLFKDYETLYNSSKKDNLDSMVNYISQELTGNLSSNNSNDNYNKKRNLHARNTIGSDIINTKSITNNNTNSNYLDEEDSDKDEESIDEVYKNKLAVIKDEKENTRVYHYGVKNSIIRQDSILYTNKGKKAKYSKAYNFAKNTSLYKSNVSEVNNLTNELINNNQNIPYMNIKETLINENVLKDKYININSINDKTNSINNDFNEINKHKQTYSTSVVSKRSNCANVDNIIKRLYNIESKKKIQNPLRTFYLLNNNAILLVFQKASYTYIYKLPKDYNKESNSVNKFYSSGSKNYLLSSDIKSIINVFTNKKRNYFIYMVENKSNMHLFDPNRVLNKNNVENDLDSNNSNSNSFESNYNNKHLNSPVSFLFLNSYNGNLSFVEEVLKEYYSYEQIIDFDVSERKKIIYMISNQNYLKCYDYHSKNFLLNYDLSTYNIAEVDEENYIRSNIIFNTTTDTFNKNINVEKLNFEKISKTIIDKQTPLKSNNEVTPITNDKFISTTSQLDIGENISGKSLKKDKIIILDNTTSIKSLSNFNNTNNNDNKVNSNNIKNAILEESNSEYKAEKAINISSSPISNLLAIGFSTKVVLFGNFKNTIRPVCEYSVRSSYIKFSCLGHYIAIFGESNTNIKQYNIYIIDSFSFKIIHVIENIPYNIVKLEFINNDKMIFVLTKNSFILGWKLKLDLYSVNFNYTLKEKGKSISKYLFDFFYRLYDKNIHVSDFCYDYKNNLMIIYITNSNYLAIYANYGEELLYYIELEDYLSYFDINYNLNSLVVALKNGKVKLLRWPILNYDKNDIINNSKWYNLINNDNSSIEFSNNIKKKYTSATASNSNVYDSINSSKDFKSLSNITNVYNNNKGTNNNLLYANNYTIKSKLYSGTPYIKDTSINRFEIPLHNKDILGIKFLQNLKTIISCSVDNNIYFCSIQKNSSYGSREFELLNSNVANELKQSIIINMNLIEVQDYEVSKLHCLDKTINLLDNSLNKMQSNYNLKVKEIEESKRSTIKELENQKEITIKDELLKCESYNRELNNIIDKIEAENSKKENEHKKKVDDLNIKYDQKLNLYRIEINRINFQMDELTNNIETKFNNLSSNQLDYYDKTYKEYTDKFNYLNIHIEELFKKLMKVCAEYDDAIDIAKREYIIMEENVKESEDKAKIEKQLIKENKEKEEKEKTELFRKKQIELYKCKEESNLSILKNAEIKQNIIDTTQRTITLQEQLLETEKNLEKIQLKLKDLTIKNKHLEQMRFVLEHRMKSLEKEKAPLEDQCNSLVKQKQKLEDEFNKLNLQINLYNQNLESMQSQLKANLIQNFEIEEQLEYLKQKLSFIKSEFFNFKESHKNKIIETDQKLNSKSNLKSSKGIIHLHQINKATYIAHKLKDFYDRFFKLNINYELLNYKDFKKKLKEDSEKTNASSNVDLILRNKGEEKLNCEKEKLDQIKLHKEIGFRRMENENTILISEANRLRKYLHEVYLRVIDIEKKFENLTHINPNLSKTEIVYQIKDFIKRTHNNIKSHFSEKEKDLDFVDERIANNINYNTFKYHDMYLNTNNKNENRQSNICANNQSLIDNMALNINQQISNNVDNRNSEYEGLILPPIIK